LKNFYKAAFVATKPWEIFNAPRGRFAKFPVKAKQLALTLKIKIAAERLLCKRSLELCG